MMPWHFMILKTVDCSNICRQTDQDHFTCYTTRPREEKLRHVSRNLSSGPRGDVVKRKIKDG